MINSKNLISKAEKILDEEGITTSSINPEEELAEFILPGLNASKDTLEAIYFKSRSRSGFLGKIKTKLQEKIIFTVINVIEKQSMKQQKFNILTYKAIERLALENKQLREKLVAIEKYKNDK